MASNIGLSFKLEVSVVLVKPVPSIIRTTGKPGERCFTSLNSILYL